MTDSSNTRTKVAELKTMYKTTIPNPPIIMPLNITTTRSYALPVMPELETHGSIELVHDPNLPERLINGLYQFADTLKESQLDDTHLGTAKRRLELATDESGRTRIKAEVSVLPCFDKIVAGPVQYLCLALGLEVYYGVGPKIYNIDPDFAWIVEEASSLPSLARSAKSPFFSLTLLLTLFSKTDERYLLILGNESIN
ncbi:hypothetical protein FS837_011420 [Tulasnella sp. UAMH 9824]|nr:hypothetical protein FS837_011420 [Tulasnella sp. UAMH 9824]